MTSVFGQYNYTTSSVLEGTHSYFHKAVKTKGPNLYVVSGKWLKQLQDVTVNPPNVMFRIVLSLSRGNPRTTGVHLE